MDLMALTDPELVAVGKRLNGGTFGKDPARMSKIAKVAYLRELATNTKGISGKSILEGIAQSVLQARIGGTGIGSYGSGSGGLGTHEETKDGNGILEDEGGTEEGSEGEGSTEEQENWESEHSSSQGSEGYESDGSCKECGANPSEGEDHKDECGFGSNEDENGESSEENSQEARNKGQKNGKESSNGSEDGTGSDSEDKDQNGSEDSEEDDSENESTENEFQDEQETEGKKPRDKDKKPPKGDKQDQKKRDAMEERVREIVNEMLEEDVLPSVNDGINEGFSGLRESLEKKLQNVKQELEDQEPKESQVSEEQVKAIVESLLEQNKSMIQAKDITIKFPDVPKVNLDGKHPLFPKLLALMALSEDVRQPIMLVGPAGSGKSHVCQQVAEALERPFGALSLSADMTRGAIEGRVMPLGEGKYVPSEFIRLYENGGVYLFDEIDAAAPEVLVTVNAALANGGAHVEARAISNLPTYVPRHTDTRILAAANTFGTGPTAQYVSRSQMDAATLDRWLILYMDYDKALWASLTGAAYEKEPTWEPIQRTEDELKEALLVAHTWIENVASRVQTTGMKRIVSVRSILRARALLTAGFSWDDTKDVLLAGWGEDEKAQVTD